jgi:hypothetical protein
LTEGHRELSVIGNLENDPAIQALVQQLIFGRAGTEDGRARTGVN